MKRWLKWLIIAGIVAVLTVFFGSMILFMLSYVFKAGSTLFDWLATASTWLAKVVDFFGFTGIFSASADVGMTACNSGLQITNLLKGGF